MDSDRASYLLIPYKQRCLLLQSPLRTCTVRNGGNYLLSQCDMNSLLAANAKWGNIEVRVRVSYDKSIYKHDDIDNYVIFYVDDVIIVTGLHLRSSDQRISAQKTTIIIIVPDPLAVSRLILAALLWIISQRQRLPLQIVCCLRPKVQNSKIFNLPWRNRGAEKLTFENLQYLLTN